MAQEVKEYNEEEERNNKKVTLKLITGGKEPPSTSNCWLDDMGVGSCFLVKKKNDPFEENLGLFRIDKRTEKAVIMNSPLVPHRLYYDPVAFCNKWRLFEDLGIMIEAEEIQRRENELQSHRTEGDNGNEKDQME